MYVKDKISLGLTKTPEKLKNGYLGTVLLKRILLATPFILLETVGNTFSDCSSIPNCLEIELQLK